MTIAAIAVFVAAYVLIATERFPKVVTALTGAGILLALGVMSAEEAFYSHETGVDWNVVFLLLGMMIIVSVLRKTGVFEFLAIWAAKRAKGSPLRVMVLLVLVTAVASAFLDNVTTVLLMAPVTLLVCDGSDPAGTVPDRRGPVVQHRRRGDPDRGPAEHHHRQPSRPGVQRLPHQHGADRGARADRLHGHPAPTLPGIVPGLRGAQGRGHVPERARGDQRPAPAHQVRGRADPGVRRLRAPFAAAHRGLGGCPARGGGDGADHSAQAPRLHGGGRVGDPAVLRRALHPRRRTDQVRGHRQPRRTEHRGHRGRPRTGR